MNEIIGKAHELAFMIQNSEIYKRATETDEIQKNDEKAQQLIKEYNDFRRDIAVKIQYNEMSQEESDKLREDVNEAFDKLMEYDVIKNYVEAQQAYEELNQEVLAIITGTQGGCSGSCSSCSGCH